MAQPQISNDDGWVTVTSQSLPANSPATAPTNDADWTPVTAGATQPASTAAASPASDNSTDAAFAMNPMSEVFGNKNVLPGLISGVAGAPGDTFQAINDAASWAENKMSSLGLLKGNLAAAAQSDAEHSAEGGGQYLTSDQINTAISGKPIDASDADQRAILHVVGNVFGVQALQGLVHGVIAGAGAAKTFLPGAFDRIQAPVRAMAPDIEMGAPSEIDNQVSQSINARKAALMKARSQGAQARLAEIAAQSGSYAPTVGKQIGDYLAQHFADNVGSMTEGQSQLYEKAANQTVANRQLTNPVTGQVNPASTNLEGYDNARRMLNDIGSGEMEGYDAVTQARAKELAGGISTIMRNAVPKFDQYLDWYKQASEPLDAFKTPEVAKFAKPIGEFDMTPKYIAGAGKTMFSSPTAYTRFTDAIGNPDLVEQISRNKAANDLIALTENQPYGAGAKAVQRWINRNEWIKSAPDDVQQTVTDYQQTLEKVARVRKGTITGVAAGALLHYGHTVWGLRALLAGSR